MLYSTRFLSLPELSVPAVFRQASLASMLTAAPVSIDELNPSNPSNPCPIESDWTSAYYFWLSSRPSEHTRRAYSKSWQLFLDYTRKQPWEIGRADVAAWVSSLRDRRQSVETINQRLAALSSFYTYVTRSYTVVDADGAERPLHAFNPAAAVPHTKSSPYNKSSYLSAEQARAFLQAIPRHTLQGLRDYALFLAYLATGRRNSELRLLRWSDFDLSQLNPTRGGSSSSAGPAYRMGDIQKAPLPIAGEGQDIRLLPSLQGGAGGRSGGRSPVTDTQSPVTRVFYRWHGKGKTRRDECPLPVWRAIHDYLRAANRLKDDGTPLIQPSDYLFTPLNDHAARLRKPPSANVADGAGGETPLPGVDLCCRGGAGDDKSPQYTNLPIYQSTNHRFPSHHSLLASRPLSSRMIDRLVKKYARRAGLDPSRITVHTLRHTAAMLRKQAGDDLESISSFLCHSSLAVTQVYLHTLEGRPDATWLKVANLLGIDN
jgi:site-specific recombinase XerD